MLLVFVGQAIGASALSCQMDMKEDSAMMDHSSHMMSEPDESPDDCCTKTSGCSMSGCISLALPSPFQNVKLLFTSELIAHQTQLAINQFPTSLYRPPILG